MKKIIIYTVGLFFALSIFTSCESYLDIVPDETPKVDDFFVNRTTSERFLYALYSDVAFNTVDVPDMNSVVPASDLIYCSYFGPDRPAGVVMGDRGTWNASQVTGDLWSRNASNIRQCYVFLDKIDGVPGVSDQEKNQWKAEAQFLIAYMHFQMLRQYGPIYLANHIYSINETIEELSDDLYRHPYDECVEWIAGQFAEAAEGLPATISDLEISYYGKPTKIAALSLIARLRLYAASPLFNGNADLSELTDNEGNALIDATYDESKWQVAAVAIKAAIDAAEAGGHLLMNDYADNGALNYKMAIVDAWNDELIWGASRPSSFGKSSAAYFVKTTMPVYVTADDTQWGNNQFMEGWIEYAATLKAAELFYTENGLPIDEDPQYNYESRYNLVPSSQAALVGASGNTMQLHENRSPRFYASIGYDRGLYYSAGDTTLLKMHLTEPHGIIDQMAYSKKNVPATGYYMQKMIHPEHSWVSSFGQEHKYAWPLIRLAELYLSYAEALNEADGNISDVLTYLNKVRSRAGIPNVETSWGTSSFSKEALRKIIQRERSIELCFEGHRQWDMKRWKRLEEFYEPAKGVTITAKDEQSYNLVKVISEREYDSKKYLYPIKNDYLVRNRILVQNPGW